MRSCYAKDTKIEQELEEIAELVWTLSICDTVTRSSALPILVPRRSFHWERSATLLPSRATCFPDRFALVYQTTRDSYPSVPQLSHVQLSKKLNSAISSIDFPSALAPPFLIALADHLARFDRLDSPRLRLLDSSLSVTNAGRFVRYKKYKRLATSFIGTLYGLLSSRYSPFCQITDFNAMFQFPGRIFVQADLSFDRINKFHANDTIEAELQRPL